MENLNISTTQNVDIEYQLASVGDRIIAYVIDAFFLFSYSLIMILVFSWSGIDISWPQLLFYLPVVFYNLLCETFLNGQSFGKMIMHIRVAKLNGGELTFGSCLIRWVFRLVDFMLMSPAVALITILVNGKGQRIGDILGGTTVLKTNPRTTLDQTGFVEVDEDHDIRHYEVEKLSDTDIQTIKEVLLVAAKDQKYEAIGAPHPLLLKTREAVQKKMGIDEKIPSKEFLNQVLKDYNFMHK
jgi:uncharacterized RDD family membrane protein YckC